MTHAVGVYLVEASAALLGTSPLLWRLRRCGSRHTPSPPPSFPLRSRRWQRRRSESASSPVCSPAGASGYSAIDRQHAVARQPGQRRQRESHATPRSSDRLARGCRRPAASGAAGMPPQPPRPERLARPVSWADVLRPAEPLKVGGHRDDPDQPPLAVDDRDAAGRRGQRELLTARGRLVRRDRRPALRVLDGGLAESAASRSPRSTQPSYRPSSANSAMWRLSLASNQSRTSPTVALTGSALNRECVTSATVRPSASSSLVGAIRRR